MTAVAYYIHRAQYPDRRQNLDRSYRWIKWLVDTCPDIAIMAPWLPYCEALAEGPYRERGMRDGVEIMQSATIGCGIVCGPEVSSGCRGDIATLWQGESSIVDLTPLAFCEPPPMAWTDLAEVVRAVVTRACALGRVYYAVSRNRGVFSAEVVEYAQ